jgi:hypothetical protein
VRRSTNMKTLGELTLLLVVLVSNASHVSATTITGLKDGDPKTATKAPYTVSLKPTPVEHLDGPTDDDLKRLKDREAARRGTGRWTFAKGDAAPGTFEILQYAAFIAGDLGGADFVVLYDDGVAAARTDYSWIQIARPEDWGRFDNKTSVDALFSNFPFYSNDTPITLPTALTPPAQSWVNPGAIFKDATNYPQQKIQNPAGGGKIKAGDLMFTDEPFCSLTCADKDGHAQDIFDLFLVEFAWNNKGGNNAGGTVTIRDGMRWGVEITCDDEGDDACNVPEPPRVGLMLFAIVALAVGVRRSTAEVGAPPGQSDT